VAEIHIGNDRQIFSAEFGQHAPYLRIERLRHLTRVSHRAGDRRNLPQNPTLSGIEEGRTGSVQGGSLL
jgi:hypothetical protein